MVWRGSEEQSSGREVFQYDVCDCGAVQRSRARTEGVRWHGKTSMRAQFDTLAGASPDHKWAHASFFCFCYEFSISFFVSITRYVKNNINIIINLYMKVGNISVLLILCSATSKPASPPLASVSSSSSKACKNQHLQIMSCTLITSSCKSRKMKCFLDHD